MELFKWIKLTVRCRVGVPIKYVWVLKWVEGYKWWKWKVKEHQNQTPDLLLI